MTTYFARERDEARRERDQARADLARTLEALSALVKAIQRQDDGDESAAALVAEQEALDAAVDLLAELSSGIETPEPQ